jgi:hypothetical protein
MLTGGQAQPEDAKSSHVQANAAASPGFLAVLANFSNKIAAMAFGAAAL